MAGTLSIGAYFRNLRKRSGYTVQDVALSTNLRPIHIRAIEANNLKALPGMIYAVGFVKTYADFLGLDPESAANQFKLEFAEATEVEQNALREKTAEKRKADKLIGDDPFQDNRLPSAFIIIVALLFFGGGMIVWSAFAPARTADTEAVNQVNPPPVIETAAAAIEIRPVDEIMEETAEKNKAAEEAAAAEEAEAKVDAAALGEKDKPLKLTEQAELDRRANTSRVRLVAERATWVSISNGAGDTILKKVMRPGDEYYVPDERGVRLSTSNAGGLAVYVDTKKVLPIGNQGDIVRGISLEAKSLKNRRALPRSGRR